MRKLATIRQVTSVEPIKGKDRVELAHVDGWTCMVSKADNFKQGSFCVFCEPDLYVFNFITPIDGRWDSDAACKMVNYLGLKFVPIIYEHLDLKGKTVQDILDMSNGQSKLYNTLREGIVFRSADGKKSFKAVSPEFLIKHNE